MTIQVYNNNPTLKAAGVKLPFTQEQVEEYVKCAHDPIYFIKKYCKIVHVDKGLINFDLFPFQEEIIETYNTERKVIVKLPRQSGKTTTTAAFFIWFILFNDNKVTAILANKAVLAREILARVKMMYEHLPMFIQQGITEWNKGSIALENGSRIIAAATTSSGIRGYSLSLVFLDEFAHVGNNIAEEFFTSIFPTISSGKKTKILIASTPNGMNHFYKFWVEAENNINGFKAVFYPWESVPGRDKEWLDDQERVLGDQKFRQEVLCDFIGSSATLIAGKKLAVMAFSNPIYQEDTGFDVYEYPIPNRSYVLVCDPSRGLGKDSSAFSIIDITEIPYRLVAKYKNNTISPIVLPSLIFAAATRYNRAFVLVEINDNGQQIADMLHWDLEYENIFRFEPSQRTGPKVSSGFKPRATFGIKTTEPVKRVGCTNLKTLIEQDKLIITDYHTINELSTFVQVKQTWAAEEGRHDDLVMTLVLFSWLTTQKYFRESVQQSIRVAIEAEHAALLDTDMAPFGVIDNGLGGEYDVEDEDVWQRMDKAVDKYGSIDSLEYGKDRSISVI
jgi:hypothetical protein